MGDEDVIDILQSIGADPEVLHEYNCQPLRARIVRGVVRIRTPYGTWGLKKVFMPTEKLYNIHLLTEYVARVHLFLVPRFIKTRYGDPFVIHPTGLYYMMPWLPGRETDLRKPQHFVAGASLLAAWHANARGFHAFEKTQPAEPKIVDRLTMGQNLLNLLVKKAKQGGSPSPFERLVIASEDELMGRIQIAKTRFQKVELDQLEMESVTGGFICHGRFFKKNILFDGDSYTVVNYEYAAPGSPLAEFAFYLHRYMPAFEWDEELLTNAVFAYHANLPLNPLLLQRLSALIGTPFRPLQIITWYQNREVSWEEEDFIDAFEIALDLEESRDGAAMSLQNLEFVDVADESSANSPEGKFAGDVIATTGVMEQTAGTLSPQEPRRKRRRNSAIFSAPSGPTILKSDQVPIERTIADALRAADKHGRKHNEQKHEDEQI